MTPGELAAILGAAGVLLGSGGWVANLALNQAQRRKAEADAEKAEIDLTDAKGGLNAKTLFATAGELVESLRREVARLADRLATMEKQTEEWRKAEAGCQASLERAQERIRVLEERAARRDALPA